MSDNVAEFDPVLTPRKGMPSPRLDEAEFRRRYLAQFADPAFESLARQLQEIVDAAWDAYKNERKSPHTRKAGPGYHDPDYDLSVDWIAARGAIEEAQRRYEDWTQRPHILLINGSSRSEHTCPGEMSKSHRMMMIARNAIEAQGGVDVDILELDRLASEYGRHIHPCKACFSTSPALCHWPCSCYPNHSLGQTQDWMNEIYPLWVGAHGIMIITPVNWYNPSSPIKLMMDRLVPRQESRHRQEDRDGWLELSAPPSRAIVFRRRAWRYGRRRKRAARVGRLAAFHGAGICRRARQARGPVAFS